MCRFFINKHTRISVVEKIYNVFNEFHMANNSLTCASLQVRVFADIMSAFKNIYERKARPQHRPHLFPQPIRLHNGRSFSRRNSIRGITMFSRIARVEHQQQTIRRQVHFKFNWVFQHFTDVQHSSGRWPFGWLLSIYLVKMCALLQICTTKSHVCVSCEIVHIS